MSEIRTSKHLRRGALSTKADEALFGRSYGNPYDDNNKKGIDPYIGFAILVLIMLAVFSLGALLGGYLVS